MINVDSSQGHQSIYKWEGQSASEESRPIGGRGVRRAGLDLWRGLEEGAAPCLGKFYTSWVLNKYFLRSILVKKAQKVI